jgi:pilus assembly protein CpaF
VVRIADMPQAAPLAALLAEPDVTDVLINGSAGTWIDGPQGLRRVAIDCGDPGSVRALAVQLAALGGQRLDDAMPTADVHLPGGIRMHAILPPLARNGPIISLRVIRQHNFSLEDLVAAGSMPHECAELLAALIKARVNFLVSGATGAGKTTLLATLLGLVPPHERIVCVEEASELQPEHAHFIRLEARRPTWKVKARSRWPISFANPCA